MEAANIYLFETSLHAATPYTSVPASTTLAQWHDFAYVDNVLAPTPAAGEHIGTPWAGIMMNLRADTAHEPVAKRRHLAKQARCACRRSGL